MPLDEKSNSHILLKKLGIQRKQVKEVRYLCNEIFGSDKLFMHFKSSNNELINSIFTGDQSQLTSMSYKSGFTTLDRPNGWEEFHNRMGKTHNKSLDFVSKEPTGGLTNTLFGSSRFGSFWTIGGDDPANHIFECGSYHRDVLTNNLATNSPAMARTSFQMWFRGSYPTQEEVRTRMINKLNQHVMKSSKLE